MPDDGEAGGGMIFSHPAVVIAKGDIEHPVQTVFNSPMRAYRMGKARGVFWQGRDEVSHLSRRLAITFPDRDDATNAGRTLPMGVTLFQPVDGIALGICSYVRVSILPLSPSTVCNDSVFS